MRISDWSSDVCSADLFSGNWHPPGRPDWRCNRAACADNVIVMTARKDFEAVAPMHTPPDGVSFHALHFAESLQLEPDPGQSLHVVHARGQLGRASCTERVRQ